MAELQDIETYLIEHPDDHAQRWRLTKKLYMACEYRDALSHLLILKRNTEWKLNYSRYLAATYYRLGRYEEALQELETAITTWPHEIPLREQLARAYEVSQETADAIRVWQDILAIDPQHPIAAQSIQRLSAGPAELSSEDELNLTESDSGIDLEAGVVCPKCGARNSVEFDRCWQCHASLTVPGTPTPKPKAKKPTSPSTASRVWTLIIGLATVALLSAGVYITLAYAVSRPVAVDGFIVATSVDAFLDHEWFVARVVAGCTLLIVWPAILWIAAITCCDRPVSFGRILGVSLSAAALTYLLLWLPFRMLPVAFIVPVILTLIMIPVVFPVRLFRALIAWSVQIVLMVLSLVGVIIAVTNVTTFNHLDTLMALDAERSAEMPNGVYTFTITEFPARYTIRWEKSGSEWVNGVGQLVRFEITREGSDAPVTAEFLERKQTLVYRPDETPPFSFTHKIAPGRDYELSVKSQDNTPVRIGVAGLLLPKAQKK
ncbi:MAG: BTAD domain-containing putative transcriptional regulator [Candidatus Hydrogenedentota bacterium]